MGRRRYSRYPLNPDALKQNADFVGKTYAWAGVILLFGIAGPLTYGFTWFLLLVVLTLTD